jgi:hypothetical protein
MQGVLYRMLASGGAGVVATRAVSASYTLLGGFPAVMETGILGRPWATGVMPFYPVLRGGGAHSLHGAELDLGPNTQITVGGKPSTINGRSRDRIDFTMPSQTKPGPAALTVINSGGTSHLTYAVGVLPMLEVHGGPWRNLAPNRIVYRGVTGDLVVYLLAASTAAPLPIPPYSWGFELDFVTLVFLTATVVTESDGVTNLDIPPVFLSSSIYLQGLALSHHPGYNPGSFTNTIRL